MDGKNRHHIAGRCWIDVIESPRRWRIVREDGGYIGSTEFFANYDHAVAAARRLAIFLEASDLLLAKYKSNDMLMIQRAIEILSEPRP